MFNWDSDKSSKKLSIDEDCLSIKVKDGSGFKTSLGDQVIYKLISRCIGFQGRRKILLLSVVELGQSNKDRSMSKGNNKRPGKDYI